MAEEIRFNLKAEVRNRVVSLQSYRDDILEEITEYLGYTPEEVRGAQEFLKLFNEVGYNASETVTLFYNDTKRLKHEPCFDFRNGDQLLPRDSVVIGYLTDHARGVVSPPHFHNEWQKKDFKKIVLSALISLGLTDHKLTQSLDSNNDWVIQKEEEGV